MAAIVASPQALSIWRTFFEHTSPAAYIPGTDVSIFSLVMMYPSLSCSSLGSLMV